MQNTLRAFILFIFSFCFILTGKTQSTTSVDTVHAHSKRLLPLITAEASLYAGSMFFLNKLWYADYPRSSFHFFNDNKEWQQMDKMGHFTTSYYVGVFGIKALKWAGVDRKKAIWYGGALGSLYLLNIEILDGLSSEWGFSTGDFTANSLGSALAIGQELAWNDQRIQLKWSYHETSFAEYRPDLLGSNLQESILKDYNGQTYWLSCNIGSFLPKESRFPKWLNVAVGYGAEGMIGGYENPESYKGKDMPSFNRYRQLYISPDVDFTKIKTKSSFLKAAFYALNFLKFPAPALEYSTLNKLRVIPIYF